MAVVLAGSDATGLECRHADRVHAPDADTQSEAADEDERRAGASARKRHPAGRIEPNA